MLNVFVHTPLMHSVLMLLTVLQAEPKPIVPWLAGASGVEPLPLLQAARTTEKRKALLISKSYQPSRSRRSPPVTFSLLPRTTRSRSHQLPHCSGAESHRR